MRRPTATAHARPSRCCTPSSRATSDFFEQTLRHCDDAKELANWITNELLALFKEPEHGVTSIDALPFKPFDFAELVELVAQGRTNRAGARTVLRAMCTSSKRPRELVRELGLERVDDAARLEAWCRAALVGKDSIAAAVRAGNEKALGALIGPVMKLSGGNADPQAVRAMLAKLIGP